MGLNRQKANLAQVWTSFKQLQGREFCFIFNELVREDELLEGDVTKEANYAQECCVCAAFRVC